MSGSDIGKKAELKIKEWLNHPESGYSIDRIPDQLSGFYGSSNICDFTCYKYPEYFYIESKATWEDRFSFSMISPIQHDGLLQKSKVVGVHGLVIVLFATYQRAFILNINDIDALEKSGKKSINIKKIDDWTIPYAEIPTVPNSRKQLLDYTGDLLELVNQM